MVRLFLISVLFSVCLATNLNDLTPEQVDQKHDGALFVQYYQPTCASCQQLEPTWNTLIDTNKNDYFGKLNCAKYGDYCQSKGIVRFPTIQSKRLFSDEWNEFSGLDTLAAMQTFVNNDKSVQLKRVEDVESIISSKKPWFIKFYAPWCGHCKNLAPIWEKLAVKLQDKEINLAEVNCEDNKDICSKYKVTGLPTLTLFVHGGKVKYNGGERSLEKLEQYAITMSGSPVHFTTDANLAQSLKKSDVNFVYVYDKEEKDISMLEENAPKYFDSIPFYKTNDPKTISRFNLKSLPAFIIVKDNGHVTYNEDITFNSWIEKEKTPLVTRVLPHNSNSILKGADDHRYVVLGMTKPDDIESETKLRDMAKQNKKEDAIFAVLDGVLFTNYVSRVYGITVNQLPSVVILDKKNQVYHNKNAEEKVLSLEDTKSILNTLMAADTLEGISTAPSKTMSSVVQLFNYVGDHWIAFTSGVVILFVALFVLMMKDDPVPSKVDSKSEKDKKDD
ncbi:thioredoxin-domain-containing protein, partial [Backusella circina FSU 941]